MRSRRSSICARRVESSARSDVLVMCTSRVCERWQAIRRVRPTRGITMNGLPMLARLDLRGFSGDLAARLARSRADGDAPLEAVREIIQNVRERGDDALREYTERFDGCSLDDFE